MNEGQATRAPVVSDSRPANGPLMVPIPLQIADDEAWDLVDQRSYRVVLENFRMVAVGGTTVGS
jgi:hypothetical protein